MAQFVTFEYYFRIFRIIFDAVEDRQQSRDVGLGAGATHIDLDRKMDI